MSKSVDFNLHDFVGIRLLGAGEREVGLIQRQIGPISRKLEGEPDISLRFVDRLESTSTLISIGLDDAGFDDEAFFVLRSKNKSRARIKIPLENVGRHCEIVCERGVTAVPHLIAIINLTALAKGILPLHASAFDYQGTGVVTTGWAKGGKTETLLSFMEHGASYVGDEWIYFGPDERIYGIPEPIRLWDWHLENLPGLRGTLSRKARFRLLLLRFIASTGRRMSGVGRQSPGVIASTARRVCSLVERQRYAHFPPHSAFGQENCVLRGKADRIFLMLSHESDEVAVRQIPADNLIDRMVFSLQEERADLVSLYNKFRFAFPERRNEILEECAAIERDLLRRLFDKRTCYELRHPYLVPFERLFDAVEPYIAPVTSESA